MPSTCRPRSYGALGFTLVEMLVSLTIFAMIVGLVGAVLISSNRAHRQTSKRADVQSASRQAISLLTTELRQAGADPRIPPVGLSGVVLADSATVRIRADINSDGAIQTTEPSEDVTFSYDEASRTLRRDPGSGAATALSDVTNLRFTYFDATNQPLTSLPLNSTDRARVHTIAVTITCDDGVSHPFISTTSVTLRNQ